MSEKEEVNQAHEGHRERLKQRFQQTGLQGFQDYEVLELLLTYSIPRRDTKAIAKKLIQEFKNFQGVLSADENRLNKVIGARPHSTAFLKVLSATIAYYFDQKAKNDEVQFTNLNELADYFLATIGTKNNEVMRALYLNSRNKLIQAENLPEGTVSETVAFPRKIVESALKYKATTVIIAHNHPGGIPEPSDKDNSITRQINDALKTVSISLQEHIIIAPDGFYSYRQNGFLE